MARPAEQFEPQADSPVNITPYLQQQRAARRPSFWRLNRDAYTWALVALMLGLFVTAQLRSKPSEPPVDADYPRRMGAATIQQLEREQTLLKQEIAELRRQINMQQEQAASNKASFSEISTALKREQERAGLTPLQGPGIKVTLDDSPIKNVPAGDEAGDYLVHEFFLRDIVNVLWAGGAEGISLNGERIVPTTSIYCVGSTILVNSTRLSPPYVFLAIGDSAKLQAALNEPTALLLLKHRVQNFGVQFNTAPQTPVRLPAFDGTMTVKYAQPGVPKEITTGGNR
ncbi:MAG: DUF881 domain-containing protein [Chloroflexota bacterium]